MSLKIKAQKTKHQCAQDGKKQKQKWNTKSDLLLLLLRRMESEMKTIKYTEIGFPPK
jgi:hypothetical protein